MKISKVFKNGKDQWRVSFSTGDKQVRKFFHSKHEADEFASKLHKHQGQIAEGIFALSPGKQALLMEAFERADHNNVNILLALDYYLANHGGTTREKLRDVLPRFLAMKKKLAHGSYNSLRVLLTVFELRFGNLELAKIDRSICHDFLYSNPDLAPTTLRGYKTILGTFFNWCIDEGLLTKNPVERIKIEGLKRKRITFFNVAQCRKLLTTAKDSDPGLVPLIAIGMFAGIRLGEMRGQVDKPGLTWDQVYLDRPEAELEIADEVGKTGRRMVPVSDNLKAWLERGGELYPIKNHRKRLDKVRELAELGELGAWEWDSSILRHTFATMHVAHHKNPDHTRYLMGHEEKSQVFRRHYDGRVSPAEAVEFWEIAP